LADDKRARVISPVNITDLYNAWDVASIPTDFSGFWMNSVNMEREWKWMGNEP